ncbi:MAG: hypothetical protein ACE5JL_00790 [Dehalococcoidia bacterium]
MTGTAYNGSGFHQRRLWANLFEVTNLAEISVGYRLLEVRGLPPGGEYDKNVNQLVKAVSYEVHQPVALVRHGDTHFLAMPGHSQLPRLEQQLMPHVAQLEPVQEIYPLEFDRLDSRTAPIATAFLQFALRGPLFTDHDLWGSGRLWYSKQPLNARDSNATVDTYPGFSWNVIETDEGRLFLAVDTVTRYIDRLWLTERLNGGDPAMYRGRRCLYCFGHQWYTVQFWGLTGLSIAEQRFQPEGRNQPVDVLTYTQARWQQDAIPWVRNLSPESPAIIYRYPGSNQQRYGALALCRLTVSTADAEAAGRHGTSILNPHLRFRRITEVVEHHFQHAKLGGYPIKIATTPLEPRRRVFQVPTQRFGHGRVLGVSSTAPDGTTDVVPIQQLGQKRLQLLLDPQAGPLDTSPFDTQYLILPLSSPRAINDDFADRFVTTMRQVSGQNTYGVKRILYDDREATSLHRQVQAIKQAISDNTIQRGYALLVLPERSNRDLHNYIKRELWPDLQFQCAMAGKIRGYYQEQTNGPAFRPAPDRLRRLGSYVRGCAFGMMVVNRKWSWALAQPLRYDVYIGIDLLNRMAGLTFVYNHAEQIFFRDYPCRQKERLTRSQIRDILIEHLRDDLTALGVHPRSIVIHRDGRTFSSELNGLHDAVRVLQGEGHLPPDIVIGVVDIRKSTADHLRLVEGERLEEAENPTIGSHLVLGAREGIVCTTGLPFRFPGTAKPLAAEIVEGPLDIEWVLEDIFALSQPVFTAPDKCSRLPLTIKLTDDFLEPIAADADEEAALYDTEEPEALEAVEHNESIAHIASP